MKMIRQWMVWATIIAVPLFFGGCAEMSNVVGGGGGVLAPNSSKPAIAPPRCGRVHGTAVVKVTTGGDTVSMSGNPYTGMTMTQSNSAADGEIAEDIVSQTGCFKVLASDATTADIQTENRIAGRNGTSGMQTADYVINFATTMMDKTGGGAGGAGALVSGLGGPMLGAVVGMVSVEHKEASVSAKVIDRSRAILVRADGASKSTDIGLGAGFLSGISVGGGYQAMTPDQRVKAAADADAMAKLVPQIDAALPSHETPRGEHHKKKKRAH